MEQRRKISSNTRIFLKQDPNQRPVPARLQKHNRFSYLHYESKSIHWRTNWSYI